MPEKIYYCENEDPALWVVNYEEEKIPPYTLPDLLVCRDGKRIVSSREWREKRRPEVLSFFEDVMYGELPGLPDEAEYETVSRKENDLNGLAARQEIRIHFRMKNGKSHFADALLFLPAKAEGKVPVFIGLTFKGNQVCSPDPSIRLTGLRGDAGGTDIKTAESLRGTHAQRFPLKEILSRGYAILFASCHDFFPDRSDGWEESIYSLFYDKNELEKIQWERSGLSAWAWGISRLADLAQSIPEIDGTRLVCYGHSRLGKASLWAGANDERFSLVCVNDSGCGGAALSRRLYGETLFSMCRKYNMGYWFRRDFWEKSLHVEKLEMDQHGLIALVAPRAVAVHSATEDRWADPYGEYLSACHAGSVYRLFGKTPLESPVQPPPGQPAGTDISYLLREGKHDILLEDFQQYMDAADRIFSSITQKRSEK